MTDGGKQVAVALDEDARVATLVEVARADETVEFVISPNIRTCDPSHEGDPELNLSPFRTDDGRP
jgi:hypothetical protein